MEFIASEIPGVMIARIDRHDDDRGFFSETYRRAWFEDAGINVEFVQDNHTFSAKKGTVRGLHFQAPPREQAKLVRVSRGRAFDVVVDVRVGAATYGRHVAVELSEENWDQLYVPPGFAHGFCTLEADTEVLYKVSAYYSPQHDKGLLWNDPALGIRWPVGPEEAVVSDRDGEHPLLADLPPYFTVEA
jgi:dTDP-4-dehydrorhamnose 3,5-epimerase